jgi:hypothetical protein
VAKGIPFADLNPTLETFDVCVVDAKVSIPAPIARGNEWLTVANDVPKLDISAILLTQWQYLLSLNAEQ